MAYVPNPDDTTNPTDAVIAETAQAEFRSLKVKINAMVGSYNSDSPVQAAVTLNPATITTTQPLGTNTNQIATMAAIFNAIAGGTVVSLPGFIYGFTLSNDATTSILDVAIGVATDHLGTSLINLAAPTTVNSATVGVGGFDVSGISGNLAILVISGTAGQAVIATQETAVTWISPTLPTGYTKYRYIGSVIFSGGIFLPFVQVGQEFFYSGSLLNALNGTNPTTAGTAYPLPLLYTPLGIDVKPKLAIQLSNASTIANSQLLLSSGFNTSVVQAFIVNAQVVGKGQTAAIEYLITDTSGRINIKIFDTTSTVVITVAGYTNPRCAPNIV